MTGQQTSCVDGGSKRRRAIQIKPKRKPLQVVAAQTVEINPDQLEGKSAECRELGQLVMERSEPLQDVSAETVVAALNEDKVEECRDLQQRIANAGDAQQRTEEREKLSEEVDLSEEATIEGEAEVTVPDPDVDVQVPAPNVQVTKGQPRVDISQQGLEIELEQRQPKVAVEIPEIIVRVDIPAPRVYVLRSEPTVAIDDPDPQIEVTQGEPQVSVTQGEPQLNLDLELEEDGQTQQNTESRAVAEGETQQQQVEGDTEAVQSEPQVEVVETEGEPRFSYESGQPQLSYRPVQPQVSVMMSEQPTVEIEQTGEAEVIVETPEERERRRQQQQQVDASQPDAAEGEQAPKQPKDQSGEQQKASAGQTMTINELMDMTVVTSGGEDLGSPEAFIDINGETHLVVGSGGFLGIGEKEVPVPMSNVSVGDGQLVIATLTEEQIEAANDFDYDENLKLPRDRQVQLNSN